MISPKELEAFARKMVHGSTLERELAASCLIGAVTRAQADAKQLAEWVAVYRAELAAIGHRNAELDAEQEDDGQQGVLTIHGWGVTK